MQVMPDQPRVLVVASPQTVEQEGLCLDALSTGRPQQVLGMTYERSPAEFVSDWRAHNGELPASMALICPADAPSEPLPDGVHETRVAADDLTGVGIAVSRYLDRWADTGRPTTACLDSLGHVLDQAPTERVFRFLHTVTGRFVASGAAAHVHLDPTDRDEQTVGTLASLFDSVVRYEDGRWTVTES